MWSSRQRNRLLWQGAQTSGRLHAVSSVGSGSTTYSAPYDAAGDMTCRAIGSLSCTTNGSPTGQVLGYDALRRLISGQNASSLPTATASYAYDGQGSRIWQQTVSGPGGARPERLATEATARAAGASVHVRTIRDASAISPRPAQTGSLRQPVARSFVDCAIGPIAFLTPGVAHQTVLHA